MTGFDVSELSEEDLGHFEFMVNGPSWHMVLKPYYEKVEKMYMHLLLEPDPDVRKKYGGDDYLRVGANNIRKTLEFFERILAETNHERVMQIKQQLAAEGDSDVSDYDYR